MKKQKPFPMGQSHCLVIKVIRKDSQIQLIYRIKEKLWPINTETSVEMKLEAGSIIQNTDPVNQEKNGSKSAEVLGSHFSITVVLFLLWTQNDYFGNHGTSFSEIDLFGRTNSEWKLLIINLELMKSTSSKVQIWEIWDIWIPCLTLLRIFHRAVIIYVLLWDIIYFCLQMIVGFLSSYSPSAQKCS